MCISLAGKIMVSGQAQQQYAFVCYWSLLAMAHWYNILARIGKILTNFNFALT